MSSDKQHDTQLLIRTIRPELFRFVVIEYDLFSAISTIQTLLSEAYPKRSVLRLSTLDKSYREIVDSIYYAQRIQKALMPSEKYLEKVLNKLQIKN